MLGGWGKTVTDGIRAASIWKRWVKRIARVFGYADNESLRYDVSRG